MKASNPESQLQPLKEMHGIKHHSREGKPGCTARQPWCHHGA